MQDILDQIAARTRPLAAEGTVAKYIPALARVDPTKFAIAVVTADGREFATGDADEPFSIQSISKLFTLALAMEWASDGLWDRVKREPSGMRFNSLILLEQERGVPRNPFINAGAIIIADALLHARPQIEAEFRREMRLLSASDAPDYDDEVHRSEMETGDLNRAIAFALKAYGNLREDPMKVTDAYFQFCSMAMSARDLARAAMFLVAPEPGEAAAPKAGTWFACARSCGPAGCMISPASSPFRSACPQNPASAAAFWQCIRASSPSAPGRRLWIVTATRSPQRRRCRNWSNTSR